MIRFLDNTSAFLLPTGWHEVTTKQYCDLLALPELTPEAAAPVLAGRAVDWHPSMADTLDFLSTEPEGGEGLPFPEKLDTESFLQVEYILQQLAEQPIHEALPHVYGAFVVRLQEWHVPKMADMTRIAARAAKCLDYYITEVYPAFRHCVGEVARLQQKYKRLYQSCTCEECTQAEQAGVGRFAAYKHFNQLKRVAQDYTTTPDVVAQWPWQTFALHLLHERDAHEYQIELKQLQKPQNL